jgi:hypothetical protein
MLLARAVDATGRRESRPQAERNGDGARIRLSQRGEQSDIQRCSLTLLRPWNKPATGN